jgi:hypothetical protein
MRPTASPGQPGPCRLGVAALPHCRPEGGGDDVENSESTKLFQSTCRDRSSDESIDRFAPPVSWIWVCGREGGDFPPLLNWQVGGPLAFENAAGPDASEPCR